MDEHSRPLFPVVQSKPKKTEATEPVVSFSSFRPAETATTNLVELLSSEGDESEEAVAEERTERKRTRPAAAAASSETEAKRHRKTADSDVFYLDRKGDKQNLLYQGIYRLDVPSYRGGAAAARAWRVMSSGNWVDRYFYRRNIARERSKKLRRFVVHKALDQGHFAADADYISVSDAQATDDGVMETAEEGVLRRTREFNAQLRQNPYELSAWMRYADFQDEAILLTRRRVTASSTAEKKLSILGHALKFHPKSEELLGRLLELTSVVTSPEETEEKYRGMLSHLPHSMVLWKSYWSYVKSTFTDFSCERMRGVYEGSLRGIAAAIQKRESLAIHSEKGEEDVVQAFLAGVQFDFQSGYVEKAVAKLQAVLEWVFCSPENKASLATDTLHTYFREFWESAAFVKIGEDGARGFAAFMDAQILEPDAFQKSRVGGTSDGGDLAEGVSESQGWTGWFEIEDRLEEEEAEAEEIASEEDELEAEPEESEAELMRELGLKLEELENVTAISVEDLDRFLETERVRSKENFLPLRQSSEADADVDRLVLFEELQPLLFDLNFAASKKKLLLGSLALLGLDVSGLLCSNDDFLIGLKDLLDCMPAAMSSVLQAVFGRDLEEGMCPWYLSHASCGQFAIKLLDFFAIQLFPTDIRIRKLWLRTAMQVADGSVTPVDVGKSILQSHKSDLSLWVAYASCLSEHSETKVGCLLSIVLDAIYDPQESGRVWRAILETLKRSGFDQTMVLPVSVISEMLEASAPSFQNLLLIAYVATSNSEPLITFLRGVKWTSLKQDLHRLCSSVLESKLEEALASDMTWEQYEWLICYVHYQTLLKLSRDGPLKEGLFYWHAAQAIRQLFCRLPENRVHPSRQYEALHEKYCLWLSETGVPPKELREALTFCLARFPSSPILLKLFVRVHLKGHTISALLSTLKSQILSRPRTDTVALVLCLEKLRSVYSLSRPGLFDRVISLKKGRAAASPLFWKLYLNSASQGDESEFRRAFLRSIRACPWSKTVWMTGLELSHGHLKGSEVVDYIETMKEKGVRLRTDLYEILLESAAQLE